MKLSDITDRSVEQLHSGLVILRRTQNDYNGPCNVREGEFLNVALSGFEWNWDAADWFKKQLILENVSSIYELNKKKKFKAIS